MESIEMMNEIIENVRPTNTLQTVFRGIDSIPVNNPVTSKQNDCLLINTRKVRYYIHTYDPRPMLERLRVELREEISAFGDILDKFVAEPRERCCNVVSITLYFKDCKNKEVLTKYLYSIKRTIKNVHINLPDWIVRLYLDTSVFNCINSVNGVLNSALCGDESLHQIYNIYHEIKNSENVEIYTFQCESIGTTLPYEKTRTFRYLVLQDPEVNVCAIREADGFVSNTDCHNLQIFSRANRMFYFPLLVNTAKIIDNSGKFPIYGSYNIWLKNYKTKMRPDFFSEYLNMYDLLAGMIATRLKLKSDFYFNTMRNLYNEINNFPNADSLRLILGFDEIFLLEIYKEIISISNKTTIERREQKRNLLFFADNVNTYRYAESTSLEKIIEDLK